jgi:UDP-N-acetylmuramoyl-L-alanyl-D-glutamate--2,6-diaminopimelate ligase
MGALVERFADKIVVTTDNPRNENPKKIIDEILAGLSKADEATVIEDRAAAIAWTIAQAGPSDVVLIAGKGHEDYQEVNGERRPFSDAALASATAERKAGDE